MVELTHSCQPGNRFHLRHSTIPMCPAVLENETAESIYEAIRKRHPCDLWSYLGCINASKSQNLIVSKEFDLYMWSITKLEMMRRC